MSAIVKEISEHMDKSRLVNKLVFCFIFKWSKRKGVNNHDFFNMKTRKVEKFSVNSLTRLIN
jgi:hypothetical protein